MVEKGATREKGILVRVAWIHRFCVKVEYTCNASLDGKARRERFWGEAHLLYGSPVFSRKRRRCGGESRQMCIRADTFFFLFFESWWVAMSWGVASFF